MSRLGPSSLNDLSHRAMDGIVVYFTAVNARDLISCQELELTAILKTLLKCTCIRTHSKYVHCVKKAVSTNIKNTETTQVYAMLGE